MKRTKGIDVSHWQDDKSTAQKMDFQKAVDQGTKFVFIKVSERGSIDRDFEYNWKTAKEAGLLRGGYHFLRWDLSGIIQARIFCDIMKDDPGELPPVADYEAPKLIRPGREPLYPSNALLEQFLLGTEDRDGRIPILYTSPGYWKITGKNKHTGRIDDKWRRYPLWVAHYTKAEKPMAIEPWGEDWTFWQYTATGDGLAHGAESKGLDINWFNGDLMELMAFAGQGELDPPAPPPGPPPNPNTTEMDVRLALNESKIYNLEKWARGIGYK